MVSQSTQQVIEKAVEKYGASNVQKALGYVDRKAIGKRISFEGDPSEVKDAYGYLLGNSNELSSAVGAGSEARNYAITRGFNSVEEAAALSKFAKPNRTQEIELNKQINAIKEAEKLGQTKLAAALSEKIVKENPQFFPSVSAQSNVASEVSNGSVKQVGAPILTETEAARLTAQQRKGVIIVADGTDIKQVNEIKQPSSRPVFDEKTGIIEGAGKLYQDALYNVLTGIGKNSAQNNPELKERTLNEYNRVIDSTLSDIERYSEKVKLNTDSAVTALANIFRKNNVRTAKELDKIQKDQKALTDQEIESFNRLNYDYEQKYGNYDQIPAELADQYTKDFNKLKSQATKANNQADFYNALIERIPLDPNLRGTFVEEVAKGALDVPAQLPFFIQRTAATAMKNPVQAVVETAAGAGAIVFNALGGDPQAIGNLIGLRVLKDIGKTKGAEKPLEKIEIKAKDLAKTSIEVLTADQKTKIIKEVVKGERTNPAFELAQQFIKSGTGITQLIRTADGRTFLAVEAERARSGTIAEPQFRGQRNLVLVELGDAGKGKFKVLNTAVGRAATIQNAATGIGQTYYNITILPSEFLKQNLYQKLLRKEKERKPSTTLELLEQEKSTTLKKTPLREITQSKVTTYLLSQERTAKSLVSAIEGVIDKMNRTGKIPFEDIKRVINIERRLNEQTPFTAGERAIADLIGTTRGTIIRNLKSIEAKVINQFKNIGEGENLKGISRQTRKAIIKDTLVGAARSGKETPTLRVSRKPIPSLFEAKTAFEKRLERRIERYDKVRNQLQAVREVLQERLAERERLRNSVGLQQEPRTRNAVLEKLRQKEEQINRLQNKERAALKAVQDFGKVNKKKLVVSGVPRVVANVIAASSRVRATPRIKESPTLSIPRSEFYGKGKYERTEGTLAALPKQKSQLLVQEPKANVKVDLRVAQRSRTSLSARQQERLKEPLKEQVKVSLGIRERIAQRSQQRFKQQARVREQFKVKQETRLQQKVVARPTIKIKSPSVTTGKLPSGRGEYKGKKTTSLRSRRIGFDVAVKEKGKFRVINKNPFSTAKEALGFGFKRADVRLARSVKLVPTTRGVPIRSTAARAEYEKRVGKFRPAKNVRSKGVFVEKSQFALEKGGRTPETRLIQAARASKRGAPRLRSLI